MGLQCFWTLSNGLLLLLLLLLLLFKMQCIRDWILSLPAGRQRQNPVSETVC
jgi:hypothetical protein